MTGAPTRMDFRNRLDFYRTIIFVAEPTCEGYMLRLASECWVFWPDWEGVVIPRCSFSQANNRPMTA